MTGAPGVQASRPSPLARQPNTRASVLATGLQAVSSGARFSGSETLDTVDVMSHSPEPAAVQPPAGAHNSLPMKKVSLIIPVYNESAHLQRFLETIDNLELPIEKELVIIDDCSRDNSAEILRQYPFRSGVQLIYQPHNQGKGAALRTGIEHATGDIIGIQDADFEYEPTDIPRLLQPLLEGKADVVFGSRFKKSNPQVFRTFHYLVNRILTIYSNLCSGLYLTDMETCYKFFSAEVIHNVRLESNRFGFEPEVTAKIAKLKLRVYELPISYYPRNYLEGKKITWMDGIAAFRHITWYNFFTRSRNCFHEGMPEKFIPPGFNLL
jgi:glycosyltransferase involved in cell wall biosynthesis